MKMPSAMPSLALAVLGGVLALLAAGCQGSGDAAGKKTAPKVEEAEMNTAALLALRRAGVKVQLLEARPGTKDLIPGAKLLPFDSKAAAVRAALPDKKALYVTYCASERCGASGRLAKNLRKLGYENVVEFRDGWAGWSAHKAGKKLSEAHLNTAALAALRRAGGKVRVVDARSGKWDNGRRIPGAATLNAKSSAKQVSAELGNKDRLVVTYCVNPKCPASGKLAKHLRKLGYKNVIEYPQGIEGWTAAGGRTEKAGK